jgi:hypothetical protein
MIDVSIIGTTKGVQAQLEALDTALNPLAVAAFLGAEVAPYLQQRAKARFADEGDDVVGRWLPLKEATERIRLAGAEQGLWNVGPAHPINVRTHEMEEYVTSGLGELLPTAFGAVLNYPRPRQSSSLRAKMKGAQQGTSDGRTPPRPVIGLNERDLIFVLQALAWHMASKSGRQR